jgi:hypothetical protein
MHNLRTFKVTPTKKKTNEGNDKIKRRKTLEIHAFIKISNLVS